MTADEAEKLILILRKHGVRSWKDGDLSVELAPLHRIDPKQPSPDEMREIIARDGVL